MPKYTVKCGPLSASTDNDEIKKLSKSIKQFFEKKKLEKEENKIQNLRIGFWLQETGACFEKAVVKCSKKDVRNRIKIENFKEPLRLLFGYRVCINDFFNEDEFIEKPELLYGHDEYTTDDFDVNCFIGPENIALRVII